jgi:hypothetical protein
MFWSVVHLGFDPLQGKPTYKKRFSLPCCLGLWVAGADSFFCCTRSIIMMTNQRGLVPWWWFTISIYVSIEQFVQSHLGRHSQIVNLNMHVYSSTCSNSSVHSSSKYIPRSLLALLGPAHGTLPSPMPPLLASCTPTRTTGS